MTGGQPSLGRKKRQVSSLYDCKNKLGNMTLDRPQTHKPTVVMVLIKNLVFFKPISSQSTEISQSGT